MAQSSGSLGRETAAAGPRAFMTAPSIDVLVGAHTEALEAMFRRAAPADPGELGERPRGLLLSASQSSSAHLLLRPVIRAFATRLPGWEGVVFDADGRSGQNRILGREVQRFVTVIEASKLDGRPALVLSYADLAWPLRSLRDELRRVGPGIALGQAWLGDRPFAWFGLSAG